MTAVVKWILFRRTLKGVCFMTCIVRPRPVMCTISSHKVLRRFLPSSDQTEQTELDSRHALHSNNLYWGILLHLVSSLLSSNNVLNPFLEESLAISGLVDSYLTFLGGNMSEFGGYFEQLTCLPVIF